MTETNWNDPIKKISKPSCAGPGGGGVGQSSEAEQFSSILLDAAISLYKLVIKLWWNRHLYVLITSSWEYASEFIKSCHPSEHLQLSRSTRLLAKFTERFLQSWKNGSSLESEFHKDISPAGGKSWVANRKIKVCAADFAFPNCCAKNCRELSAHDSLQPGPWPGFQLQPGGYNHVSVHIGPCFHHPIPCPIIPTQTTIGGSSDNPSHAWRIQKKLLKTKKNANPTFPKILKVGTSVSWRIILAETQFTATFFSNGDSKCTSNFSWRLFKTWSPMTSSLLKSKIL